MLTLDSLKLMETHRKLTFIGMALLLEPLESNITWTRPSYEEFNYAYVTGIAILAVFMASFILFNKDRWKNKNLKNTSLSVS